MRCREGPGGAPCPVRPPGCLTNCPAPWFRNTCVLLCANVESYEVTYREQRLVVWVQCWWLGWYAVVVCVEDGDRDAEPRQRVQLLSHFAFEAGELEGRELLWVQGWDEDFRVDRHIGQVVAKLDGAFEHVAGVVERVERYVQGRHGHLGWLLVVW